MHERKTDSQHYELIYEENESGEKELVGYKPTDRISDTPVSYTHLDVYKRQV